ncbi:MAG: hypothetical protein AAF327_19480 [Cyanobacteria bacterium P01_A01_bin.37]
MERVLRIKAEQHQRWEKQLNELQADLENAFEQLSSENDDTARGRIKRRIDTLQKDLEDTAQRCERLQSSLNANGISDIQVYLGQNQAEPQTLDSLLEPYHELLRTQFEKAYQACLPRGWPDPIPPKLSGKLAGLANIPSASKELPIECRFVAYLVGDRSVSEDVRHVLTEWGCAKSEDFGPFIHSIQGQFNALPQGHPYLLIVLNPSPQQGKGHYFVDAWVIPDSEAYTPKTGKGCQQVEVEGISGTAIAFDELANVMGQLLDECPNYIDSDPRLDIFVSMDLIMEAVDQWAIDDGIALFPEPIGCKYYVSIRSSERLLKTYGKYLSAWNEKWASLKALEDAILIHNVRSGDVDDLKKLTQELFQADVVGLKVAGGLEKPEKRSIFRVILQAALPIAVWVRQQLSGVNCTTEIDNLLECCAKELSIQVKEKRKEAQDQSTDSHIGHHLSVLIENPNLVPPKMKYET